MSLTKLRNKLKSNTPCVLLVVGDALPLMDEALGMIDEAMADKIGLPAFNRVVYHCSDDVADEIFVAASTIPMMADSKLVIVKDLQAANANLMEALVDYVKKPIQQTVMVLSGQKLPKGRAGGKDWGARLRNAVKKGGYEYLKLDGGSINLPRFVAERVAGQEKQLSSSGVNLLIEIVGNDPNRLALEVDKLVLFVGEKQSINTEDVHAACSALAITEIWDLTGGLARGDAIKTESALQRLQAQGAEPRHLLATIAWQLRSLMLASDALKGGADDRQAIRVSRLRPALFRSARSRLQRGLPTTHIHQLLARAHRDMNQHRAGDHRILQRLISNLLRVLS